MRGVFYCPRKLMNGLTGVNPVQLYVDFTLHGSRGEEQADFLIEHALAFRESMADAIEITKAFPTSRERTVLLELLKIAQTLKEETIDAVVCGGWVPFLKERAHHSQTAHSMRLDIDVLFASKSIRPARVRVWPECQCSSRLGKKNR
jgi:hypothetical protein